MLALLAGTTPTFNDNRVREAMLMERQSKERENYLQTLRNDAFIKVTEPIARVSSRF